jgi:hypothetical protein
MVLMEEGEGSVRMADVITRLRFLTPHLIDDPSHHIITHVQKLPRGRFAPNVASPGHMDTLPLVAVSDSSILVMMASRATTELCFQNSRVGIQAKGRRYTGQQMSVNEEKGHVRISTKAYH